MSPTFEMPHTASRRIATIPEALAADGERELLFVEVGDARDDAAIDTLVRSWSQYHPNASVLLFASLGRSEPAAPARIAQLGAYTMLAAPQAAALREGWHDARLLAVLSCEIVREFAAAVERTGRPLPCAALLERLLAETPTIVDVHMAGARALDREHASHEARRKAVWRRLRESNQLPASRLLLIFRVLWFTKLIAGGWSTHRIAAFLGYHSPRVLRVMLKRRAGVCIRELREVSFQAALAWAADRCTDPREGRRDATRSCAALVGRPTPSRTAT